MLPFLKRRNEPAVSGLMIKTRSPDEPNESDENDPAAAHEACASEIIQAIEAKDSKRLAEAFKDMFQILESEPHDEAPHGEPQEP